MAVLSNSFTTYEAVGMREDLTDVITNISPVDTWFTSNSGTAKNAKARYHEWQTDSLAAAAANAQIEGDDAPAMTAATATTRLGNYTQILRKVFAVSMTEETIDKAGRDSEIAYQTQKNLKELAKDIEYALLINATSTSASAGSARTLKGVLGWITTNVTNCSAGTATATQQMSEAILTDNLALIWAEGGEPSTVLCGGWVKRKIDALTTNTRQIDAADSKLVAAVDVFKSSFGAIKIRLHRQIQTTTPGTAIVFGDMQLWQKAWLRKTNKTTLAKTGDNEKFMILCELTLEARQEKGSGKITNLSTS